MKIFKVIILLVPFIITSCGTSYILTDKGHDIFINGEYRAKEKVEIKRNGAPKKLNITIKNDNNLINEGVIKRRFTIKTGIITYFFNIVGLLTTWQFDKEYYFEGQQKPQEENIWEKDPDKKGIWQ